jgi:release factor glutamine methyltransferase
MAEAASFLKPAGFIAVEVGAGQAPAVAELARLQGFEHIELIKDIAGIERVVVASRG